MLDTVAKRALRSQDLAGAPARIRVLHVRHWALSRRAVWPWRCPCPGGRPEVVRRRPKWNLRPQRSFGLV